MNRRKFTTNQAITDAIREVHEKNPNTWLHLSKEAVDACINEGVMLLKGTESDDWNLLEIITIEGKTYRFNLENPTDVLFFDMA